MRRVGVLGVAVVLASMGLGGRAEAQASGTWVSGVGDDANPCSRTAPCKTFAIAISKTAAGGEIRVLDPGGYGGVTITKSITIIADGELASILVSGTNAININAGVNDVVVLRNLKIIGLGTGLDAIKVFAAKAVYVEDCTIHGFTRSGIEYGAAGGHLSVKNTEIRDTGTNLGVTSAGIFMKPSVIGTATLDNVRLERNQTGLLVNPRGKAAVSNSVAADNTGSGFRVSSSSNIAVLTVTDSVASGNGGVGIHASGTSATANIGGVTSTMNATGVLGELGGALLSWGNNQITGNTTDGSPTGSLTLE